MKPLAESWNALPRIDREAIAMEAGAQHRAGWQWHEFLPSMQQELVDADQRLRGPVTALPTLKRIRLSNTDAATLGPRDIERELEKIDAASGALTDHFIALGRGHERPSDLYRIPAGTDPLADYYRQLSDRRSSLTNEIELRAGPGHLGRFPYSRKRGDFGPRRRPEKTDPTMHLTEDTSFETVSVFKTAAQKEPHFIIRGASLRDLDRGKVRAYLHGADWTDRGAAGYITPQLRPDDFLKARRNPAGGGQVARFPDGGYAVHKLTGSWTGTVSAWFDSKGALVDAEQKPGGFGSRSRKVRRPGPMWEEIQRRGRIYATSPGSGPLPGQTPYVYPDRGAKPNGLRRRVKRAVLRMRKGLSTPRVRDVARAMVRRGELVRGARGLKRNPATITTRAGRTYDRVA